MTVVEAGDPDCRPTKRLCLAPPGTQMTTSLHSGVMVNGYGPDNGANFETSAPPVATLCNLGNTCFLNSVLYTLRLAPCFLHNLHHLATDLVDYTGRYNHLKNKSSSLGRSIGGKTWTGKELATGISQTAQEDKVAVATLRLHELYENLHNAELREHSEPYQPEIFLTALREVNSIFEGNQQHDAHELLVCLLDNIRETCQQLCQLSERQRRIITPSPPPGPLPPLPLPPHPAAKNSFTNNVRKRLKLGKAKSNGVLDKKPDLDGPLINGDSNGLVVEEDLSKVGHNFISEDFQGVTVLRTTCLECEQVTERKETFCDICVPITPMPSSNPDISVDTLYHSAIVTEEFLHESNKYWCEQCLRYNEARRCVRYESLPKLLILQLKRFSSSSLLTGSVVSKVNDYMPTPMTLNCFCIKCIADEENRPHRGYQLYGVIMHLGATMASGHYVTYVCGRDTQVDCMSCTRDRRKTASLSGGAGKTTNNTNNSDKQSTKLFRFFKSKPVAYVGNLAASGPLFSPCRSSDCCGARVHNHHHHPPHEPTWLECDDETVRVISRKELEDILAPKNGKNSALTPYLLFYTRINSK